ANSSVNPLPSPPSYKSAWSSPLPPELAMCERGSTSAICQSVSAAIRKEKIRLRDCHQRLRLAAAPPNDDLATNMEENFPPDLCQCPTCECFEGRSDVWSLGFLIARIFYLIPGHGTTGGGGAGFPSCVTCGSVSITNLQLTT